MQDGGPRRGARPDMGHIPALLEDVIGSVTLSRLTPASVRGDRQTEAGYAKSIVVKRMNFLASIIAHSRSEWDVPPRENVATGRSVKRPPNADRKRNRRLRVPSAAAQRLAASRGEEALPTEEEALYAAVGSSESELNLPMLKFATAQGTRLGEQLGLRWRDVDFEARTLTLIG